MHNVVDKIISIKKEIQEKIIEGKPGNYKPTIVAISKTFSIDKILPLINYGHDHFGENKVQEALEKWNQVKETNPKIKLHMVGKLQTNKVKNALKIFDYIHSLDSIKLAEKIANEQKKLEMKPKLFIQINIGKESQKSGIDSEKVFDFYKTCKKMDLNMQKTSNPLVASRLNSPRYSIYIEANNAHHLHIKPPIPEMWNIKWMHHVARALP